jgi:acyl-CoA hydrolase
MENALTPRPVRDSVSQISEMALPNDANPLGNLIGGKVMHLVDVAAAIAANRHARMACVTASVDYMTFLHPVHIGELVILRSSVNRVFTTSMEVGVKVWVENLKTGQTRHTSSAYLTFVGIDSAGSPIRVPPVVPETDEEKRRFEQAGVRRAYRLQHREQLRR